MLRKLFGRDKKDVFLSEPQTKLIPEEIPSTPEQIKDKIIQELPFEVFKKMMMDLSHKTPNEDGIIHIMTSHPAANNVEDMTWYYDVNNKLIQIKVFVSQLSQAKKDSHNSNNTTDTVDKVRYMHSFLDGKSIILGNGSNIIMSPYSTVIEKGERYDSGTYPMLFGNYFQIRTSMGESIKNNYERVIHMLSELPQAFAQIGHDFLLGHEADMGIALDHDVAEDDKMPVIQQNTQKNLHDTMTPPSQLQNIGNSKTQIEIQNVMLQNINNKKSSIEQALKSDKYDTIAHLYVQSDVKKKDVILNPNEQQELDEIIHDFHEKIIKGNNDIKLPSGILLQGAPGTGKTSLAKMLAHETGVLFQLQSTDFDSKYVNEGETNLTHILNTIEKFAKNNKTHAFIMIDECEELFSKRDADHKAKNDITTVLLRFMDGLNEQSHTTIIGSTNVDKSLLDPGFMRPGRFDKKLSIDTPETDTLKKLWIHKLSTCMQEKGKYFNPEIVSLSPQAFEVFVDENLMTLSKGFTGADIEKGIVEPLINHSIKNDVLLGYDDIITFTEKHKKIK